MTAANRPIPVPDAHTAGYWEAAARDVLAIARCSVCDVFSHPPGLVCTSCGSLDPRFRFDPVSGFGTIRSWTVVRQALLPGFDREIPFMLVDVELEEQAGLRISGRLLDGPAAVPRAGERVRADFERLADGIAVPAFRLLRA